MTSDPTPDLGGRLMRYVVSPDLVEELQAGDEAIARRKSERELAGWQRADDLPDLEEQAVARVIVELDAEFPGGVLAARLVVLERLRRVGVRDNELGRAARSTRGHVFVSLDLNGMVAVAAPDSDLGSPVRRIWRDHRLKPFLDRSIRTIKADASLNAFGADGAGIVVAVADSGIDGGHPHFRRHANLKLPPGLNHEDFTGGSAPLVDASGHGTLVAGVVAGVLDVDGAEAFAVSEFREADGSVTTSVKPLDGDRRIRGVAPRAKLLSLKVLDDEGGGWESMLLSALERIEEINDYGRRIRVHCVNLSLGYMLDAKWFAAGQSPICAAVDRLSRAGTVVVAAAGNDGSAFVPTELVNRRARIGMDQSINDPGNAEEAITVGATHGEAPHRYGVSYFSSRGPTADGRVKPDLVAPGERILSSAAAGSDRLTTRLTSAGAQPVGGAAYYHEESGTSMAAPHVAGAVAALLSIRPEFVGRPDRVKAILKGSCVDLGRKADFQGAGLLDLMRAIQSI